MTPPWWSELVKVKKNWRASWWKWKRRVKKVGLKLDIQKIKITASSPITSWQIDGETVTDFILGGLQNHHNGDSSHEIKRLLLLGRKVMTILDNILKCWDITLPTKVCLVKAMVFPIVTYRYESWTINKAECWRSDTFELWCWRRHLRVPWTARKSKQSILNIHWMDGFIWPPDAKSQLIRKDPDAGKDWRQEEKGTTEDEMVGWHYWIWANSRSW